MQTSKSGGKPFVVAGKTAETGEPGKRPLDYPAPGQQHEATLGFGEFDDLQLDAVGSG